MGGNLSGEVTAYAVARLKFGLKSDNVNAARQLRLKLLEVVQHRKDDLYVIT